MAGEMRIHATEATQPGEVTHIIPVSTIEVVQTLLPAGSTPTGSFQITGPGAARLNINAAQGPKGDTGPQGLQGIQGIQGPKGDTGATGPAGTTDWSGIANKPSSFTPTIGATSSISGSWPVPFRSASTIGAKPSAVLPAVN